MAKRRSCEASHRETQADDGQGDAASTNDGNAETMWARTFTGHIPYTLAHRRTVPRAHAFVGVRVRAVRERERAFDMRILHTSDWHLGHTFCERSRTEEQGFFLDWLLRALDEHAVDVLVVAGDVFDIANPPAEALALYYGFLARLNAAAQARARATGRRLRAVIVGGNHDSASRLDAPSDVLEALDVTVVGGHDPARDVLPLGDAAGLLVPITGPSGGVELVVAAVPYLHEFRIGVRSFDAEAAALRSAMKSAFREVYTRLADKAQAAFPGVPLVATGHLTCLPSEGALTTAEDAIPLEINRVGTLGALGPSVFDERYAYVALGHIHRGFAVDDARRIHYSGTPVQVSPVEPASSRRVLLVDIDASAVKTQGIPVPQRRRLVRLDGTLAEVIAAVKAARPGEGELPPYLVASVQLREPNPRADDEVRGAVKGLGDLAPIVVDVFTQTVAAEGEGPVLIPTKDVRELAPTEAFLFAWRLKYPGSEGPPPEILRRFQSLLGNAEVGS